MKEEGPQIEFPATIDRERSFDARELGSGDRNSGMIYLNRNRLHSVFAGLFLTSAVSTLTAEATLSGRPFGFEERDGSLAIAWDGQSVADYVYRDERIWRPYFANLRTLNGVQVTRRHPPVEGRDATDHNAMHPDVWLGFGDLNGQDFWRNRARLEHIRFTEPPRAESGRLTFATESRLRATDGAALGSLTNRYLLVAWADAWLLVWDTTFSPEDRDLTFGDQEEMGFGARVTTSMTETSGGVVTSSVGLKTARNTWGQPAAWCDYSGTAEGQSVGLTLMADPANFRPSWWHNRDYGLMVANPFGREAMKQGARSAVTVKRGESLRLRFAVAIRQGEAHTPAQCYLEFLRIMASPPSR